MKICSMQPRRLSVPFVADHGRARENGGEKKGKVEDGRDLLWWGRFDDQRARKAGGSVKAMHAVSCIDIGPLTLLFELVDSAASYKRSRSLRRIFLSKLQKHDLEDSRISLSTVGSKQSFLTEAFDRVEHRYESGTASEY